MMMMMTELGGGHRERMWEMRANITQDTRDEQGAHF